MTIRIEGVSKLPASARRPALLKKACLLALGPKAKKIGEVNVVFLDRAAMKRMNMEYLERSHDTDVIAFNYDQPPAFGDVFISAWQVRRQADALGHPALVEAVTLVLHGALHLMGYDDATPRQKARMFKKQDALLSRLLK
jgi:probable rRNA maturation factor